MNFMFAARFAREQVHAGQCCGACSRSAARSAPPGPACRAAVAGAAASPAWWPGVRRVPPSGPCPCSAQQRAPARWGGAGPTRGLAIGGLPAAAQRLGQDAALAPLARCLQRDQRLIGHKALGGRVCWGGAPKNRRPAPRNSGGREPQVARVGAMQPPLSCCL